MTDQLPLGWCMVPLFDLCRPKQWQTISSKQLTSAGFPVYGANGQIGCYTEYNHEQPTILITCRGATCGVLNVSQQFSWINGNAMALDDLIEQIASFQYVHYALQNRGFTDVITGSAQPQITRESLRIVRVPLAPLNEQRRIVAKLGKLLSRLNAAQARLATIPHILKRFRQSVLAAASSGRLTEDWREAQHSNGSVDFLEKVRLERQRLLNEQGRRSRKDLEPLKVDANDLQALPTSWSWATVDQLSTKVVDGVHKKPNYVEQGIPFLTVRNLTAGPGISFERTRFVNWSDHFEFIKRANPENGDLLISKDGTLGVVRLVETDRVFSLFVSLAMIKPAIRTFGRYLTLVLSSPQIQQRIVVTGTGLQHIHLRDLKAVAIPIPPEYEQQEIVRRVEALFKTADALEARYLKAKAHVDKLTQSILAKAFRGELVPQDPNDEPASVLLERILQTKVSVTPKKRSTRQ